MQKISENLTLSLPKKSTKGGHRGELIQFFTDRLNEDRKPPFKPLTNKIIAIKLGHLKKLEDLYFLKSYCSQAKNFSSCFWYSLKPKK